MSATGEQMNSGDMFNRAQLGCTGIALFLNQYFAKGNPLVLLWALLLAEKEAVLLKAEGKMDCKDETLSATGNSNNIKGLLICSCKELTVFSQNQFYTFLLTFGLLHKAFSLLA